MAAQLGAHALAVEQVVAEHQGDLVAVQELLTESEGLGQTVRRGLDGVLEVHAEAVAVAEDPLECPLILGRGDDQDVPDPREHE
eukprot:Nk52_evm1s2353 gene=Nk52_evmTU1s2353